jgi:hypothetical protein
MVLTKGSPAVQFQVFLLGLVVFELQVLLLQVWGISEDTHPQP